MGTWNIRSKRILILVASITIAMAGTLGCARKFADFPMEAEAVAGLRTQEHGIALGAHMVADRNESRKYFGTSLRSRGIMAVHITVENNSDRSLIVQQQDFSLRGAIRHHDREAAAATGPGTTVAWTGAVLGSLPIAMLGAGMAVSADNIQTNLEKKALITDTLSPGAATRGFVYFSLPSQAREAAQTWELVYQPQFIGRPDCPAITLPIPPSGKDH
ncbi:MAG: hypothetical protein JJU36_04325 [Phycisphaeraceae bacterium]|nr:hypothetical protein [Phycisphaeraceae bacterium]